MFFSVKPSNNSSFDSKRIANSSSTYADQRSQSVNTEYLRRMKKLPSLDWR